MAKRKAVICRHRHGVYTKFRNDVTLACRNCKGRLVLHVDQEAEWRRPGAAGDLAQLQLPTPKAK